jgi:hypothetical protein
MEKLLNSKKQYFSLLDFLTSNVSPKVGLFVDSNIFSAKGC